MLLLDPMIRKEFASVVNSLPESFDVKAGVLNHERKESFFKNMKAEINKIREARLKHGKKPLTDDQITWMIRSMTRFFVIGVKAEADHRIASAAEKTRQKTEADNLADLDATVSGKPQGDYAEIVSIVGDGDLDENDVIQSE